MIRDEEKKAIERIEDFLSSNIIISISSDESANSEELKAFISKNEYLAIEFITSMFLKQCKEIEELKKRLLESASRNEGYKNMLDEEKKAMIELNRFSNMTTHWKQEEYTNSEIDNYIKTVLNLIEKQSKEIEHLKRSKYIIDCKTNEITTLTNDFISKNKIKAKIEELDEAIKVNKECAKDNADRITVRLLNDEINEFKKARNVLQSLLEKE